ncbi:response regulator transcription factor [Sulfurospirillum sp. 1612]|uniref:response regulator transcription factor n=1 Tax=Sulfurospirillum sp. 1612 TaxID=3094835 RepID=UPI002F92DC7C
MKILLLEDDFSYRVSIKEYLESLDYDVDDFERGQDALDAVFETDYDLLLMDVRVPTISGYEVVKAVRENDIEVPIILVTSLTDIDDLSTGYEVGCNDYIRKPFALKELKYRITQTVNNFQYKTSKSIIKLKYNFIFDLLKHELSRDGEMIKLTPIEQKILNYLIMRQGSFFTTNDIISTLWDDEFITEADLRMHIKRIRDKTDKNLIINSRGLGYQIEKT